MPSTSTLPVLPSTATPTSSSPRPSVYGRRPTATSTSSHVEAQSSPVLRSRPWTVTLVALDRRAGHLRLQVEFQPLLRQALLEQLAHLAVGQRHDPRQELDHRDLRPQPPPDRAQLQPDVTAADDDQVLGHLLEAQAPRSSRPSPCRRTAGTAGRRLAPVASRMWPASSSTVPPSLARDLNGGRRCQPGRRRRSVSILFLRKR